MSYMQAFGHALFFSKMLSFLLQLLYVEKFLAGLLSAVAYAENFHGEVSFSDIWWSFVSGVLSL